MLGFKVECEVQILTVLYASIFKQQDPHSHIPKLSREPIGVTFLVTGVQFVTHWRRSAAYKDSFHVGLGC